MQSDSTLTRSLNSPLPRNMSRTHARLEQLRQLAQDLRTIALQADTIGFMGMSHSPTVVSHLNMLQIQTTMMMIPNITKGLWTKHPVRGLHQLSRPCV